MSFSHSKSAALECLLAFWKECSSLGCSLLWSSMMEIKVLLMVIEKDSHCCWPVLVLDGPTLVEQRATGDSKLSLRLPKLWVTSSSLPFNTRLAHCFSAELYINSDWTRLSLKMQIFTKGQNTKKKWAMTMSISTAASQQAQNTSTLRVRSSNKVVFKVKYSAILFNWNISFWWQLQEHSLVVSGILAF